MFGTLQDAGHSRLVHISSSKRFDSPIIKLDSERYYVKSIQEVREYKDTAKTKEDCLESVRRSFNRLKAIINANAINNYSLLFLTLTYAENMTDNKRLMNDLEYLHRRLKEYFACTYEYIYVKEKQERGAWHIHMFLFFDGKAPYLANDDLRAMWRRGFVNVQAIKDDVNNLGNYLCAYLTNHKDGKKLDRLRNYDSGIKLYNCSRGIKRPECSEADLETIQAILNDDRYKIMSDRSYDGYRAFGYRYDRYILLVDDC
jgi:hypothetical protein